MAYALLANLPAQFGLYTSFMGVLIYWLFATSKDITIGPVAVLSTVTGNVVTEVLSAHPEYKNSPQIIASALAVVAGGIVCAIGLLRLGWIVDFISLTTISAFITGSALNIAVGQVPTLLGMSGFSSRDSTYRVVINILKHLNSCKLDAAVGMTALAMLYGIRGLCTFLARRFPAHKKAFFFVNTLRTVFVILLYTLISWLVNRNRMNNPAFMILRTVPRGFQYAQVPALSSDVVNTFVNQLPATVIVLVIEHISIAKSFGRVNNYTINPSQEFVALGVTNLLGPFLGAYPATGSFSRTAIKAKAGVRTPLGGFITAIVVLLAIYALTAVFFYISNASLAAVIIHAVGDLITPPNTLYQFWRISPLEVVIFFVGVFVIVFSSIENGVYTTICISLAVFLFRAFKAKGRFLGRVKIRSVVGDHVIDGNGAGDEAKPAFTSSDKELGVSGPGSGSKKASSVRNVFLPIAHGDGSNPEIEVENAYPGVFIYRFSEGFNYPNASHYLDHIVAHIVARTRRPNASQQVALGDRPWNEPGPRRGQAAADDSHLPELRAIIIDCSSVNNVDITSVQGLIDVRNQLERYAAPRSVAWHFACISNRWTKRALAAAGFGYPTAAGHDPGDFHRWKPIFSVAEIGGDSSAAAEAERRENRAELMRAASRDAESGGGGITFDRGGGAGGNEELDGAVAAKAHFAGPRARIVSVQGINRPLFHVDLTSALQSAISNIERREDGGEIGVGAVDVRGMDAVVRGAGGR